MLYLLLKLILSVNHQVKGSKMNTIFEWRHNHYLISTDKKKSDQKANRENYIWTITRPDIYAGNNR